MRLRERMQQEVPGNRKTHRFGQYIIKNLPVIAAFVIPVLVLVILYIARQVFPAGENMYLRSDMYHQYAPLMKEFQRKLRSGGSLLYSWNVGLGNNFAGTYAYYLASPLNWLSAVFPDTLIPEFMNTMLIIRSGLMSAAFAWYVIRKFRRSDLIATAFGCFYAMSSYMAAFSWNVMWLDCLVLLPLILAGLEKLVAERRPAMYVITLAACIISNYYISIMIAVFLVMYCIILLACEHRFRNGHEALSSAVMFLASSAIAGGMAMFIVLPALFNLFLTASSGSSFPGFFTAYYNLLEMLSKSVINTEPAVFSGWFPNIYATMALFLLVPLYWFCRQIPGREKAGKTILVCILAASFMLNVPTYIWHGLHFPNSLPCRYSFIYIFLVLVMGYQAMINIRGFPAAQIVLCAAAGVFGVFFFQALYPEGGPTLDNACLGAAFILIYLVIALMLRSSRVPRALVMAVLIIVSAAEIAVNTHHTGYSVTSRKASVSANGDIAQVLSQVNDGSFFRVEKTVRKTKNDGAWNGYPSASVFSSTAVAGNSDFYQDLGMQGSLNAYAYSGHTPVTQALLSVRYEITDTVQDDVLMTQVAASGGIYLYENRYALALGFLADRAVYDIPVRSLQPFRLQNDLVRAACGVENIFHILGGYGGSQAQFTIKEDGRCLLFLLSGPESCIVVISRGGEPILTRRYDSLELPQIIDAGDVQEGDLVFVFSGDMSETSLTVYPAIMDYARYDKAMQLLESGNMEITEHQDTKITGHVRVEKAGQALFTTIPCDEGWSVYVDGRPAEYRNFKNSFIALDLEPGEHTVEFRYWPAGLTPGILLSLAALAGFIAWMLARRKKTGKMTAMKH